jgi:hypothetical protein
VQQRIACWKYLSAYAGSIKASENNVETKKDGTTDDSRVVTFHKARAISKMEIPPEARKYLIEKVTNEGLSYTQLKALIKSGMTKEWICENEDHSIKMIINEKHKDLWDAKLKVEKLQNEINILKGMSPVTSKHKVSINKILDEDLEMAGVPKHLLKAAREYFQYYDGTFGHFELYAIGELSKIAMKEREPFNPDVARKEGKYRQATIDREEPIAKAVEEEHEGKPDGFIDELIQAGIIPQNTQRKIGDKKTTTTIERH